MSLFSSTSSDFLYLNFNQEKKFLMSHPVLVEVHDVHILHEYNEGDHHSLSGMCNNSSSYKVNNFFVPTVGMILLCLFPRLQCRTKSIQIQRVRTL